MRRIKESCRFFLPVLAVAALLSGLSSGYGGVRPVEHYGSWVFEGPEFLRDSFNKSSLKAFSEELSRVGEAHQVKIDNPSGVLKWSVRQTPAQSKTHDVIKLNAGVISGLIDSLESHRLRKISEIDIQVSQLESRVSELASVISEKELQIKELGTMKPSQPTSEDETSSGSDGNPLKADLSQELQRLSLYVEQLSESLKPAHPRLRKALKAQARLRKKIEHLFLNETAESLKREEAAAESGKPSGEEAIRQASETLSLEIAELKQVKAGLEQSLYFNLSEKAELSDPYLSIYPVANHKETASGGTSKPSEFLMISIVSMLLIWALMAALTSPKLEPYSVSHS